MSETLFAAVEVEAPTQARPGFRLDALELYNWGTFDRRIEVLAMDGQNALVTGDIGSGKSTLVDAVTTLLLPANRINYNKAAGADTRERSLRTYVLGHYRSERVESTGASRPVGLRDHRSYSVLLARFTNTGVGATTTLAQVFWMPGGGEQQPRRFFVVHEGALSIRADFTDFGADPADLKRRLRGLGAKVFDHFPEYGARLRRLLGVRSEQALELFHQTISMKSVGNLTDFVRAHMLEPADTGTRIASLVQHFEDLTRAHEAVRKARDQLAQLAPLVTACDEYDALTDAIAQLEAARAALRLWVAEHRLGLLAAAHDRLAADLATATSAAEDAAADLARLQERLAGLTQARDGVGGARLTRIEAELAGHAERRDERRARAAAYAKLLAAAGLPSVADRESFLAVRRRVQDRHDEGENRRNQDMEAVAECRIRLRDAQATSAEIAAEIRSLQGRTSSIDSRSLALRDRLAQALDLGADDLPFAGELIQVGAQHADWRGAAERLLRGFALSVLVPTEHYAAAAAWVDRQHLGARFVYFRVGGVVNRRPAPLPKAPTLADVLEVKPGDYAAWLDDELTARADHVRVDGADEFAHHRRAVTRQGQVKTDRRHEKDDRFDIGDRTRWVLGWTNADKIAALLAAAAEATTRLEAARADLAAAEATARAHADADGAISQLLGYDDWTFLDWAESVARISALEEEREQLTRGNAELAELDRRIDSVGAQIEAARQRQQEATRRQGGIESEARRVEEDRCGTSAWVATVPEQERARQRTTYGVLEARRAAPATLADCDQAERALTDELATAAAADRTRQAQAGQRALRGILAFRQAWPSDTVDLGADIAAADEYRRLRENIEQDDLPRFEAEFKKQLNTNTINDIAGFQAWLDQSAQTIRSRIHTINESLGAIDYNPGSRITLLTEPTSNQEVRAFREELRACTDDAISADNQYSEDRFRRVRAIIERFRGRPGMTEADRRWTALVTDVRNWFVFAASERDRDDGAEREHYTDSDGKSGGQKEKLAYTILAASLAYQFGLEWGVPTSRDFRFTVIDEAFGRGSDVSTRYALELFRKLGLQLLVVTPLQKVHVIEPYVAAVGFVENRSGQRSRLQTLTIEEYDAARERLRRGLDPAT